MQKLGVYQTFLMLKQCLMGPYSGTPTVSFLFSAQSDTRSGGGGVLPVTPRVFIRSQLCSAGKQAVHASHIATSISLDCWSSRSVAGRSPKERITRKLGRTSTSASSPEGLSRPSELREEPYATDRCSLDGVGCPFPFSYWCPR